MSDLVNNSGTCSDFRCHTATANCGGKRYRIPIARAGVPLLTSNGVLSGLSGGTSSSRGGAAASGTADTALVSASEMDSALVRISALETHHLVHHHDSDVDDLVLWYYGPGALNNIPDETPGQPSVNTYSTYRVMHDAKEFSSKISNTGINFSETYVENDTISDEVGQENYSGFTINYGMKSVNGMLYGFADANGMWPENSVVLGTIPNKGCFAGLAESEKQMPYNFIKFRTFNDGWRMVTLSARKILKETPEDVVALTLPTPTPPSPPLVEYGHEDDLTLWYYGPGALTNIPAETPGQPSINTYSTYRVMHDAKDPSSKIMNTGIIFSETYVENDTISDEAGQENYSGFTINYGMKSVNGMLYGFADANGMWPENSVVLGTIPNKGCFAGLAESEKQLPWNFIKFRTYPDGWRKVNLSARKIPKETSEDIAAAKLPTPTPPVAVAAAPVVGISTLLERATAIIAALEARVSALENDSV
jgi:hypothetical protein